MVAMFHAEAGKTRNVAEVLGGVVQNTSSNLAEKETLVARASRRVSGIPIGSHDLQSQV